MNVVKGGGRGATARDMLLNIRKCWHADSGTTRESSLRNSHFLCKQPQVGDANVACNTL